MHIKAAAGFLDFAFVSIFKSLSANKKLTKELKIKNKNTYGKNIATP